MYRRALALASLLAAATVAAACVTINVYFPEAAVQNLSEKIEDAVAREAEQAGDEPMESEEGSSGSEDEVSWFRSTFDRTVGTTLHLLSSSPVYAQANEVAAPEITNPAIRKIIQSRGNRVRELNRHKSSGAIGESNRALVAVRALDALPLQQRAAVQKLIKAENTDRETMFKEIAAATGTDLSQLPKIRETYAATLRRKARSGDWIQMPDGSWKKKG